VRPVQQVRSAAARAGSAARPVWRCARLYAGTRPVQRSEVSRAAWPVCSRSARRNPTIPCPHAVRVYFGICREGWFAVVGQDTVWPPVTYPCTGHRKPDFSGRGLGRACGPGSDRVRRTAQGWQPPWPRGQAPAAAGPAAAAAPPRVALRSPRALLEHAWQARRPAPDRGLAA